MWDPPHKLPSLFCSYDRHRHKHSITTPKLHRGDGAMPQGRVDKAKGWPWIARIGESHPRRWAIRLHLAWTHARGITPPTHRQHCRWFESLPHAPPNMDYPSASFCWPHYGGRHTLGVPPLNLEPRWDNRSRQAFGCLPDTGCQTLISSRDTGVRLANFVWSLWKSK